MTYSYDPTKIRARGRDQMRFELGDTIIEGDAEDGCAPPLGVLCDEEYDAILTDLAPGNRAWLFAKLYALEAILLKLSYQVDTRIDVLQYGLGDRAERWRKLYKQLRRQIKANYGGLPSIDPGSLQKPPYFHMGMEANQRAANQPGAALPPATAPRFNV